MAQSRNGDTQRDPITEIADQVYRNREKLYRPGDAVSDWQAAEKIAQSPIRRLLLHGNSELISRLNPSVYQILKASVWNTPKWVATGLLVSLPKAEWVKLLAVPLAIAIAGTVITRNFQHEAEQNRILKEYFALLETFTFERELLTQPLDSGVVLLARGRTVTTLRELDRSRREQLLAFLRASDLASIEADEPADKSAQSPDTVAQNAGETEVTVGKTAQDPDESDENSETTDENSDIVQEPVISFRDQDLSEMDLRNINLSNLDFRSANFRDANLQDADLGDANLQDAFLRDANLQDAVLVNANLQDAVLRDATLQDAVLGDANLQDAFLRDANLQDAVLGDANLQDADLGNANLQDTFLGNANLQDADLWSANLQDAVLWNANLQDAFLWNANLQDAVLRDANLQDAFLENTNLQNAVLGDANLQDADLGNANLEKAFLGNANLQGTDFRGANLQNLSLQDILENGNVGATTSSTELETLLAEAILCQTILPDYIELDGDRDCDTP